MLKRVMAGFLITIFLYGTGFCFYLKENFKEFGFLGGFLKAELQDKEDLKETPFMVRFGLDLRPIFKNKFRNLLEFVIEPYSSWIIEPKSNFRGGCQFLIKAGFGFKRIYPYLEGGLGLNYFTLQTREQSTQFNFSETIGAGINYFLKENLSLNLGYRYQHLSNASIKRPNKGIDSQGFIFGVSFYY